ncbi:hypothetical protein Tco_0007734 [Tanacetum coccineum]
MVALKFVSSHNMVAFLDKPTESDGFEQIMDFLNAHPIKYALTVNPTIYTSCIEQFWTTANVKNVIGEVQIQTLVDKKKVIITETSVRSDLQFEDAEGTDKSEITRKQSKMSKHGHENLKSTKRRQRIKAEAKNVKSESKIVNHGSGYQQKDRKPSQNDKTEHGMEKTVQNQGQSPKMPKSESILKNQQSYNYEDCEDQMGPQSITTAHLCAIDKDCEDFEGPILAQLQPISAIVQTKPTSQPYWA